jgi:hypothetical protein
MLHTYRHQAPVYGLCIQSVAVPVPIREWSDEECWTSCNRPVSVVAIGMLERIHEDSCLKVDAKYEPLQWYLFTNVLMIFLSYCTPRTACCYGIVSIGY